MPTDSPTQKTPRLLVIDDDAFVRSAMKKVFLREGFDVAGAADGQEGLEYLRSEPWHIVLLDEEMPVLKGDAVLQTIKAERLPGSVIIFSTFASEEQEKKYRDLGAAALVSKGVDIDVIIDIVRQELKRIGQPS